MAYERRHQLEMRDYERQMFLTEQNRSRKEASLRKRQAKE